MIARSASGKQLVMPVMIASVILVLAALRFDLLQGERIRHIPLHIPDFTL